MSPSKEQTVVWQVAACGRKVGQVERIDMAGTVRIGLREYPAAESVEAWLKAGAILPQGKAVAHEDRPPAAKS